LPAPSLARRTVVLRRRHEVPTGALRGRPQGNPIRLATSRRFWSVSSVIR